jgi:hypothetical protein
MVWPLLSLSGAADRSAERRGASHLLLSILFSLLCFGELCNPLTGTLTCLLTQSAAGCFRCLHSEAVACNGAKVVCTRGDPCLDGCLSTLAAQAAATFSPALCPTPAPSVPAGAACAQSDAPPMEAGALPVARGGLLITPGKYHLRLRDRCPGEGACSNPPLLCSRRCHDLCQGGVIGETAALETGRHQDL